MPRKPKFQQLSFEQAGTPEEVFADLPQPKYIKDEVKSSMTGIHHMVRTISAGNVADVDAELNAWFEKGYELFQAFSVGTDSYQTFNILYILVKRA